MERTATTARIDLQKLQILNDRLALCLDALHQVRMSVHAANTQVGYVQPQAVGFGYAPTFAPSFAPVAQNFAPSFVPGYAPIAQQYGVMNGIPAWQQPGVQAWQQAGIPAWQTAGIPAYQHSAIPTWSQVGHQGWNLQPGYNVETVRHAYTNGAFNGGFAAPTTQIW